MKYEHIWTKEEDLLLAETVLRHIRTGSTQLQAFEEAGNKLNRTAGTCGWRWNGVVRHNYTEAILFAKKLRNDLKRNKKLMKATKAPKQLEAVFEPVKEVKPQIIVKEAVFEPTKEAKSQNIDKSALKELDKMDIVGYLLDLMWEAENHPVVFRSVKEVIKYIMDHK